VASIELIFELAEASVEGVVSDVVVLQVHDSVEFEGRAESH